LKKWKKKMEVMKMLLQKAQKTLAYGKVGIFGFQGSGKTYTGSMIAIGLGKATGNKKVAFFDTETGSDWMIERLEAEGFEVYQVKSMSFTDLLQTIRECEQNQIGILIIDSITHVWRELCDSYKKKLGRKKLQFQDWDTIKGEWSEYTKLFINSKVHIVVCGRAGYEYDTLIDEEGNKELLKTGTKMKSESEFGFEPHLVIEMERVVPDKEKLLSETSKSKRQTTKIRAGSQWIHRAYVLKDRSDLLNGQTFDNPTFESFRPHFEKLNLGGEHLGVDTSRTSQDRFDSSGRPEWKKEQEQKQIALEEIKGEVDKVFPGSSVAEKRAKIRLSEYVFNTTSGTAIENKPLHEVQRGLAQIRAILSVPENINILLSDKGGQLTEPRKADELALNLGETA
jgi:hypothetical protein